MKRVAIGLVCSWVVACGAADPGPEDFEACGGDPIAGWDLTSAELGTGADECPTRGGVSGFVFLQPNGRYSVSVAIQDWKRAATDAECNFTRAYGGFYRLDGAKLCFGDSSAEGAAIPCDGSKAGPEHAVADFCVQGDRLALRSRDLFDLRSEAVLRLTLRP